jgi:hypothetical protein
MREYTKAREKDPLLKTFLFRNEKVDVLTAENKSNLEIFSNWIYSHSG